MENLTLLELQDLRKRIISNEELSDTQIEEIHLINKLEIEKSRVSEEKILFQKEKEIKILEAKNECSKRISSYDGKERSLMEWMMKSNNLQDIRLNYINLTLSGQIPSLDEQNQFQEANAILDRKDALVNKYNLLEELINNCKSISDINIINVRNDFYWKI